MSRAKQGPDTDNDTTITDPFAEFLVELERKVNFLMQMVKLPVKLHRTDLKPALVTAQEAYDTLKQLAEDGELARFTDTPNLSIN